LSACDGIECHDRDDRAALIEHFPRKIFHFMNVLLFALAVVLFLAMLTLAWRVVRSSEAVAPLHQLESTFDFATQPDHSSLNSVVRSYLYGLRSNQTTVDRDLLRYVQRLETSLERRSLPQNWIVENPFLNLLLHRYVSMHADIVNPLSDVVRKRFLVVDFDPLAGLGNRLQVLVSAFLFAVLSDRALLVNWPAVYGLKHWNKEESVGMPGVDGLLESPDLSWKLESHAFAALCCDNATESMRGDESYLRCCCNGNRCVSVKRLRGVEESLQCGHYVTATDEFEDAPLSADAIDYAQRSTLATSDVVRVRAWDYFAPAIAVNARYAALVRALSGTALFGALGRFIIRPETTIQRRVNEFVKTNFAA
jgi:hypothetical protein